MEIHGCFIALYLIGKLAAFPYQEESWTSGCTQLGCDSAGTFAQNDFAIPTGGKRNFVWTSKTPSLITMRPENMRFGCVGNKLLVACPYHEHVLGASRYTLLNPDTGEAYDNSETMYDGSMPVLTPDGGIVTTNATHIQLLNVLQKVNVIQPLPAPMPYGTLSPIYLPEADVFVVMGNWSKTWSVWRASGKPTLDSLEMLTAFHVNRTQKDHCPWLTVTEGTALGNRLYAYVAAKENAGLMAVEFMSTAPYYKFKWVLSDDDGSASVGMTTVSQQKLNGGGHDDPCYFTPPPVSGDYAGFPPVDVQMQLLATPYKFIIVTSPIGLIIMQDNGDSGAQVGISLFGAHFLSYERGANDSMGVVWMTGWNLYPPFRPYLMGINNTDLDLENLIVLDLMTPLGALDVNVTSRHTTFNDPENVNKKILVFGATVQTNSTQTPFHQKFCPSCKIGFNNVVMAVRTHTDKPQNADILWLEPLPRMPGSFVVQGQIIGVNDKLIMFATDGKSAYIHAMK